MQIKMTVYKYYHDREECLDSTCIYYPLLCYLEGKERDYFISEQFSKFNRRMWTTFINEYSSKNTYKLMRPLFNLGTQN